MRKNNRICSCLISIVESSFEYTSSVDTESFNVSYNTELSNITMRNDSIIGLKNT